MFKDIDVSLFVWCGLVYLFIHSHVTLDMSITDYNLQHNL